MYSIKATFYWFILILHYVSALFYFIFEFFEVIFTVIDGLQIYLSTTQRCKKNKSIVYLVMSRTLDRLITMHKQNRQNQWQIRRYSSPLSGIGTELDEEFDKLLNQLNRE